MTTSTRTKVKDVEHLKELINEGYSEFFIALMGGLARSSKLIYFDDEKNLFAITNERRPPPTHTLGAYTRSEHHGPLNDATTAT